jgi:SAM-dependent methyltransferase
MRQAKLFAPFTRQLFEEAGIGPGMRVLDVGSGAGDVSFLVRELVGRNGRVVGADISFSAVEYATHRAAALGLKSVDFVVGDPALMDFENGFDAVVGRLVLMYYPDPARALRKLAEHVHRGGILAFQEFDMSKMHSFPTVPTFEMSVDVIKQVFEASGAHVNLGLELNSIFLEAGLPEPSLRMDAIAGGASKFPYDVVADAIHSLSPAIQRLKVTSPTELETGVLEQQMRAEAAACKGVAFSPTLIGAWSLTRA